MRFHAEFETESGGTPFCYGVDAGADIYATLDAPSVFSWALPQSPFPIIDSDPVQVYPTSGGPACWMPTKRLDLVSIEGYSDINSDAAYRRSGGYPSGADSSVELHAGSGLEKRGQAYGPLMSKTPGMRCPGEVDLPDLLPCPLCEL